MKKNIIIILLQLMFTYVYICRKRLKKVYKAILYTKDFCMFYIPKNILLKLLLTNSKHINISCTKIF